MISSISITFSLQNGSSATCCFAARHGRHAADRVITEVRKRVNIAFRHKKSFIFSNVFDSTLITTAYGPVRGRLVLGARNTRFYSFQGIPYARPPIGKLRFKV